VRAKLHRGTLDEPGSRGDLDRSRCAIDSVNMRALKGGSGPGQEGARIHVITERFQRCRSRVRMAAREAMLKTCGSVSGGVPRGTWRAYLPGE
jgi:hypothetical protein